MNAPRRRTLCLFDPFKMTAVRSLETQGIRNRVTQREILNDLNLLNISASETSNLAAQIKSVFRHTHTATPQTVAVS